MDYVTSSIETSSGIHVQQSQDVIGFLATSIRSPRTNAKLNIKLGGLGKIGK
jgi:hypothetical protein